jgi:magnesium-protoporphyrin IX monomethyl ester (oxidative) cyclase
MFEGMIKRRLDIVWSAPNGLSVWTLDEPMLRLMKKSGCYNVTLAIESGDQDVLYKIIRKPLNLEHVKKVVKIIKKLKIETHSFFLVGFPEERPDQVERTFDFAKSLNLDSATFQIPQPLPGSRLCDDCMAKGIIKPNFDFENINYLVSSYDTPYFKGKELERKVAKEFLKYNISLIYRNPIRFCSKFGGYIIRNPLYTARFVMNFAKKAVRQ